MNSLPAEGLVLPSVVVEFNAGKKYYTVEPGPFRIQVVEGIRPDIYRKKARFGNQHIFTLIKRVSGTKGQVDMPAPKIFGFRSRAEFLASTGTSEPWLLKDCVKKAAERNKKRVEELRARFGQNGLKTPFMHRKIR